MLAFLAAFDRRAACLAQMLFLVRTDVGTGRRWQRGIGGRASVGVFTLAVMTSAAGRAPRVGVGVGVAATADTWALGQTAPRDWTRLVQMTGSTARELGAACSFGLGLAQQSYLNAPACLNLTRAGSQFVTLVAHAPLSSGAGL